MDFNVHDHTGKWVGIVESPESAIWVRRYQQPGDFELYFPATAEMLALLADDCYITREDAREVMLIEHVEIITDAENGNYILVSGRGAECLTDRRIVWPQIAISGPVDTAIYRLMLDNAISPADPARALPMSMRAPVPVKIPVTWERGTISTANGAEGDSDTRCRMPGPIRIGNGLHIATPETMRIHLYYYDASGAYIGYSGWHTVSGYTITPSTFAGAAFVRIITSYKDNSPITTEAAANVTVHHGIKTQYTGPVLLETIQEICKSYGLGFRVVSEDPIFLSLFFEIISGTNRSESQAENDPVIFSPEFENLLSSSYVLDTQKYKNVAIVAGEGAGKNRKNATIGSASGMARREMYVDARDLTTNEGEISDADYTAQLVGRGVEKIAKHQITESFDGEIDTANTYIMGTDYTLGDIVTIENEYGIRKNARITAIMETWDAEGYTSIPTFEKVEV